MTTSEELEPHDLCECCGANLHTENHYAGCLLSDIEEQTTGCPACDGLSEKHVSWCNYASGN